MALGERLLFTHNLDSLIAQNLDLSIIPKFLDQTPECRPLITALNGALQKAFREAQELPAGEEWPDHLLQKSSAEWTTEESEDTTYKQTGVQQPNLKRWMEGKPAFPTRSLAEQAVKQVVFVADPAKLSALSESKRASLQASYEVMVLLPTLRFVKLGRQKNWAGVVEGTEGFLPYVQEALKKIRGVKVI